MVIPTKFLLPRHLLNIPGNYSIKKVLTVDLSVKTLWVEYSGLEPLTSTLPVLRSTR